jgi:hypothetical protein
VRWFTHRCIGAAAGVEASVLLNDALPALGLQDGLPLEGAVVLTAVAILTSSQPDRVEKRLGWDHRTKGHYLSTTFAMALVPAAVFAVASLLGAMFVVDRLGPDSQDLGRSLVGLGFVLAILIGCGRLVGISMHTVADAFTLDGSPLGGPWDRTAGGEVRKRHLSPRFMRVRVKSWVDTSIGFLAIGLACLIVYGAGADANREQRHERWERQQQRIEQRREARQDAQRDRRQRQREAR